VILRMSRVSTIDATGAQVLGDAITRLERRGITVLLSGVATGHEDLLARLGVTEHLRRDGLIFPDTPAAIAHARGLLGDRRPPDCRPAPTAFTGGNQLPGTPVEGEGVPAPTGR